MCALWLKARSIYNGSGNSGEFGEGAARDSMWENQTKLREHGRKSAQKMSEDEKIMIVMEYNKNGFSVVCVYVMRSIEWCAGARDVSMSFLYVRKSNNMNYDGKRYFFVTVVVVIAIKMTPPCALCHGLVGHGKALAWLGRYYLDKSRRPPTSTRGLWRQPAFMSTHVSSVSHIWLLLLNKNDTTIIYHKSLRL